MTTIGDLLVRLGVDATELNRGFAASEKTIERLGTQLFFLGSRVTAGVSVPLAAAIGVIAKFGLEFDKAMTESLAIMSNVTPQIRKEMEGVALAVSETTKFSAKEAAEGYYSLASAGLDAATSMGALPIAAQFAQAGVMDLAKATDYLAAAQAALGGTTDSSAQKVADMARIADVLTQANNMALGTVQDFAEALTNKAGQQMRLFNVSVEEGTAVLAAYASMGIKGKAAGQQLHMMLRDLARANIRNSEEWKKHGIAVFDAAGNMRNLGAILQDFEKRMDGATDKQKRMILMQLGMQDRSLAATQALIGMSKSIKIYEEGLLAAGGATKRVADEQMKALTNQLLKLGHEAQNVAIQLFQAFVPTIKDYVFPALRSLLEMGKSIADFFAELPEPLKLAALGFAGLAIAIGPVTLALGSLILTGSAVGRAVIGITAVLGPMASAMATATGAQIAYNAATMGGVAAQGAAASALGIAGKAALPVVLTTTQLAQAQKVASDAAIAGARAMGVIAPAAIAKYGATAAEAVKEANRMAIANAAVAASMASAVPKVSLLTRAVTLLMNPFVGIPLVLTAAAAAWYAYTLKQEAARQTMVETGAAFKAETAALEGNLIVYRSLRDAQSLNEEQSIQLTTAIDNLAEASGLSASAFEREAGKSDAVTAAIERQIRVRQELYAGMVKITRATVIEAERSYATVKQLLDQALMGRTAVVNALPAGRMLPPGERTERPGIGTPEHVEQVNRLKAELAELGKDADKAREQLRRMLGEPERGAPIIGTIRRVANEARLAFLMPEGLREPGLGITDPNLEKMRDKQIDALVTRMRAENKSIVEIAEAVAETNKQWALIINAGKQPLGIDMGEPSEAEKAAKRLKDQISEMKATIMGTGGKDLTILMAAWKQAMADTGGAIVNNAEAVKRVVAEYQKMRQEVGLTVPEFEKLMQSQSWAAVKNEEFAGTSKTVAESVKDVADRLAATSDQWGFWANDSVNMFLNNTDKIQNALNRMSSQDLDYFFKQHGSTLDDLAMRYGDLPPKLQAIIMQYLNWKKASEDTVSANIKDIREVTGAIDNFYEDTLAKLQDSQTARDLFSKNYADREIANLQKGLAAQRNAFRQQTQKLRQDLSARAGVMTRDEYMFELAKIEALEKLGEERFRNEERIGKLRVLESLGVTERMLRHEKNLTDKVIDELIRRYQAYKDYFDSVEQRMNAMIATTELLGTIGEITGNQWLQGFAKGMAAVNQGVANIVAGMKDIAYAGGDVSMILTGISKGALGAVQALYAMSQMGERSQRVLAGAAAGAQIAPPGFEWLGAGIGALAGLFMDDPRWAKIQDDVRERFDAIISEELSREIERDFKRLNSMVEAEFRNLAAIIEEAGGLDATNVNEWANNLAGVFERIEEVRRNFANLEAFAAGTARPTIGMDASEAQAMATAAEALNEVFPMLAETGMTANGILSQQVVELIKLDRAYGTASKAVKEFVDSQLAMVAEGFNKIVAGTYAPFADLFSGAEGDRSEMDKLIDKIERYRAILEDFEKEPPKNAKQRAQQAITIRQLDAAEKKLAALEKKAAAGEEALERMFTQRGAADALNADIAALTERAEELTKKIEEAKAAGEDPSKFEMDLSETLAEIDALRGRQRELTAESQEQFDRMGRLAAVTFQAMLASGSSIVEAIEAIGPGLDILADAMQILGFESTGTVNELLRFREFIELNPELVGMLDGVNQMLKGLHNTGFMTAEAFRDLGLTALDIFNEMTKAPDLSGMDGQIQALMLRAEELRAKIIEAKLAGEDPSTFEMELDTVLADMDRLREAQAQVAAGALTSDEAMRLMQPTLQTLWEMQRAFGYEVDAATQLLLDQAEAAGIVGIQFMSANDRMVVGIERLITLFEAFLKFLNVDIPASAYDAATDINNAFAGVKPEIEVRYKHVNPGLPFDPDEPIYYTTDPEPPRHGMGGHFVNQPHLAVVGDTEEWIIRDPTFRDIMEEAAIAGAASVMKPSTTTGANMTLNMYMEGRRVAEISVPYIPDVVRDLRLV